MGWDALAVRVGRASKVSPPSGPIASRAIGCASQKARPSGARALEQICRQHLRPGRELDQPLPPAACTVDDGLDGPITPINHPPSPACRTPPPLTHNASLRSCPYSATVIVATQRSRAVTCAAAGACMCVVR